MNADSFLFLSISLLLIGSYCVILRRNTQQLLLGQTLLSVGTVATLLHLFANRIPSNIWFGLPLCVLLVVGIRLFRQSVAHQAPQRHYSEPGNSQNR